jgi:hypothetical protein
MSTLNWEGVLVRIVRVVLNGEAVKTGICVATEPDDVALMLKLLFMITLFVVVFPAVVTA